MATGQSEEGILNQAPGNMTCPDVSNSSAKRTSEVYVLDVGPGYWKALVQYAEDENGEPPFGEFEKLQALNITHLLNDIVRIKAAIRKNQTTTAVQMSSLQQRLHEYGEFDGRAVFVIT